MNYQLNECFYFSKWFLPSAYIWIWRCQGGSCWTIACFCPSRFVCLIVIYGLVSKMYLQTFFLSVDSWQLDSLTADSSAVLAITPISFITLARCKIQVDELSITLFFSWLVARVLDLSCDILREFIYNLRIQRLTVKRLRLLRYAFSWYYF